MTLAHPGAAVRSSKPKLELVLAIPTLGLLLVGFSLLHSPRVEAEVKQSNRVRELQEQRLAALSNLVGITTEHYKNGRASSEELWLTCLRAGLGLPPD